MGVWVAGDMGLSARRPGQEVFQTLGVQAQALCSQPGLCAGVRQLNSYLGFFTSAVHEFLPTASAVVELRF